MKTKTNMKVQKNSNKVSLTPARLLKIAIIIMIFLFLLGQLVFDAFVWTQMKYDATNTMSTLISRSIDDMYKPASLNPTSKVYIPEAKIVLPPYTNFTSEIMYTGYITGDKLNEGSLNVTTAGAIAKSKIKLQAASTSSTELSMSNAMEKLYTTVPELQACARGITVDFTQKELAKESIDLGSHTLKDGRTMYLSKDVACDYDFTSVIDQLKQAESY